MAEVAEEQVKVEQLKREISSLSQQLKHVSEEKEDKYKEKDAIDKKLNSLVKSAKDLRDKKKAIDVKIKALKEKRGTLNSDISPMFAKLRDLRTKVMPVEQKERHRPPAIIRKQIEELEMKIQTEAPSFEREKKFMAQLKLLKAELKAIKGEEAGFSELRSFRDSIKTKKSDADNIHEEIQKLAKDSTEIFRQLTEKSQVIEAVQNDRDAIKAVLTDYKAKIEEMNSKLEDILKQWSAVSKQPLPELSELQATLKQKAAQAEEKLKSGGKLTKEDILAMQRQAMRGK